MAETEVQICNMALARIQGEPITDLVTDDSKSAVLCRTMYEPARDAVLRDHPWSFSIKRQLLALSGAANLTAYTYSYTLPTDPYCLRPLVLLDSLSLYQEIPGYPFVIEGRILLTSMYAAGLKYIGRVTDPSEFDANFTDALSWRLAAELIKPIEGTSPVDPWVMYRDVLMTARGIDEQGKREPELEPENWVDGRFG
jgi:hypothetical protein